MEWEAAPWHRWTNKERAAGQARARGGEELSEEGEQETPGMQRLRLGGHSGTRRSRARCTQRTRGTARS